MRLFQLPRDTRKLADLPRRQQITITLTIATTTDDSVSDLAHGLSADVINAALVTHRVGARLDRVQIEGLPLRTFDRIERAERRKANRA